MSNARKLLLPAVALIFCIGLVSCDFKDKNIRIKESVLPQPAGDLQNTGKPAMLSGHDDVFAGINLDELRERYQKFATVTILSWDESRYYYTPDSSEGYYYTYSLISEEDYALEGLLTVFSRGNPAEWRFDGPAELFIELVVYGPEIRLHEKIGTGMSLYDLKAALGEPDLEKGQYLFYREGISISVFKIVNERVAKFRTGNYHLDPEDPLALDFLTRFKHYSIL